MYTHLEWEILFEDLSPLFSSMWKYLIRVRSCLRYQIRDICHITWQEITLPKFYGWHVAGNDMLHLPRPFLWERLGSLYMPRLNLVSPYGKMQSSLKLWCAKRTRIVWSHIFLGPRFCWPAPSSHAVSYFLFFCFYRVSIEQIASNFIYLLQHGDLLDEICFWTFPLLFISTLLPIRVDWFVNSIKLKSWIEATYLSSSLTRQVSRTDRCQNEMEYERCGLCVCQFWLQLPSSILW